MDYIPYVLCFLLSWITVHHFLSLLSWSYSKLPPGPTPLPIIGNLLSLGDKTHVSLARLAQTYGPIMCLQLGSVKTIVVSSSTSAKEVMQKHDISFSGRTVPDVLQAGRHGEMSMVWLPPNPEWRNLRKIANCEIFSTRRMDAWSHLRKEKVNYLLSRVGACCQEGVAVDIGKVAFDTMLNLLSNSLFSMDLAEQQSNSGSWTGLKDLVWQIIYETGKPNLSDFFPMLKWLDPQGIRGRMEVLLSKMMDLLDTIIDKRMETTSDGSSRGDVLDALLKTIQQSGGNGFNRDYLRHMLVDFFVAGTESSSSTLEWAMAELLQNPTTLKKAQEELQNILGKGKSVDEKDISRLPYLQAIVKETFRLHPATPLVLRRKEEMNIDICGFMVPANTQVVVNVWAIGKDPSTWEDANSFKPERFIGSKTDVKGFDFELIPFGAGRRICSGMPLVIRMFPLMLASLIHSFDWKLPDGITPQTMDMEESFGFKLKKAHSLMAIPISRF